MIWKVFERILTLVIGITLLIMASAIKAEAIHVEPAWLYWVAIVVGPFAMMLAIVELLRLEYDRR